MKISCCDREQANGKKKIKNKNATSRTRDIDALW
jgi:hypothetical protein